MRSDGDGRKLPPKSRRIAVLFRARPRPLWAFRWPGNLIEEGSVCMNQLAKICTGILIVAIVGCSSSTTNERDSDPVASGSASAGTPTTTESPHIGGAGGNVGTVVGAGSSALDPPGQGGSTMTGTALVSGGSGGSVTTSFDAGGAVRVAARSPQPRARWAAQRRLPAVRPSLGRSTAPVGTQTSLAVVLRVAAKPPKVGRGLEAEILRQPTRRQQVAR